MRAALRLPGRLRRDRCASRPRGRCGRSRSLEGRPHLHFALHETFRFHTGARVTAQSFADAFDRDAFEAPLTGQGLLHARGRRGRRRDRRQGPVDRGRSRARSIRLQIRLTKPLRDLPARLTCRSSALFCRTRPSIRPGSAIRPARARTTSPSTLANQRILLKRNPFYRGRRRANVDQMVWTTGGEPSRHVCSRSKRTGSTSVANRALREMPGADWRGSTASTAPAASSSSAPPSPRSGWCSTTLGPPSEGPGQIPLKKAINFAIDRPAMVRPFGYLGGKRADQLLPPSLARPSSIYPLGGADVRTAQRWYARARFKPTKLVYYTVNTPAWVEVAQTLAFNLEQIGIDLEVKYFDLEAVFQKAATPGEPFDLVNLGLGRRLRRRGDVLRAAARAGRDQVRRQPRRCASSSGESTR